MASLLAISLVQAVPATAPTAAPVDPAAQTIDRLVEENLAKRGLKPNAPASDGVFLRRIYLDVIGRIPTAEEATEFLSDNSPDKRARLIDKLLLSEGYASHWFNYWADVLRIKSDPNEGGQGGSGDVYAAWVKDQLRRNTPYNQFVYQLLTAEGYIWDNPAVGYYMRDAGMPLDNMANTCQVFLGTRVACAQCHNHPFDDYAQRDFYEMAAYTVGVDTRVRPRDIIAEATGRGKLRRSDAEKLVQPGVTNILEDLLEPLSYGVRANPHAVQHLPPDFRGDPKNPNSRDGKPNEAVRPVPVFGKRSDIRTGKEILENYAGWMTSPENPTFTLVVANRLWKQVMGLGLIEPVDDIKKVDIDKNNGDASKLATNPALMAHLTRHMRAVNYDMKRYLRTVLNTRTYQREATTEDVIDITDYHFPGPAVRRMSAEQLWDSFVTLVIPAPDQRKTNRQYNAELAKMRQEAEILKDKLQVGRGKVLLELATALAKVNEEFEAKAAPWRRRLADARAKEDKAGVAAASSELEKIDAERFDAEMAVKREQDEKAAKLAADNRSIFDQKKPAMAPSRMNKMEKAEPEATPSAADDKWQGYGSDWVRASELPLPAPVNHFVREFGQSDRNIIENSNREPSVTQALAMLNGPLFDQLTASNTQLGQVLTATRTPAEKRDHLFLTLLSRHPSEREKALVDAQLQQDRVNGLKTVAWALLNTKEFAFIH